MRMQSRGKLFEAIRERRDDILRAASAHGARNVRVFGSCVRGEDTDLSDIDFLVEIEPGRTLLDHAALVVALEDLLGRKVDVVTEKGLKERLRPRVLKEAVRV